MQWTVLALALAACGDKDDDDDDVFDPGFGDDDDDDDDDDTGAACGSDQGFAWGQVTGPYSSDPNPDAVVYAWGPADVTGLADSGGYYELDLPEGEWAIYAYGDGCFSDERAITVEACDEFVIDFSLDNCDIAEKPNLYLYPSRPVPTSVEIETTRAQAIVASDPPYRDGWRGVAWPDGTFQPGAPFGGPGGRDRAPYLFYEVSLTRWQSASLQREEGWCLDAAGAVDAMADILWDYGFNAVEIDDFVEGWRHDLPPASRYAVWPQTEVDHIARLHVSPTLPVERLWLLVDDAPGCAIAEEPVVTPFSRAGAHGVEWGVVFGDVVL